MTEAELRVLLIAERTTTNVLVKTLADVVAEIVTSVGDPDLVDVILSDLAKLIAGLREPADSNLLSGVPVSKASALASAKSRASDVSALLRLAIADTLATQRKDRY